MSHFAPNQNTAQKMKFSIKGFSGKCEQIPKKIADLFIFTKEILLKTSFIVERKYLTLTTCFLKVGFQEGVWFDSSFIFPDTVVKQPI